MSRPKGSGVLKHLDAKKQDGVTRRRMLFYNSPESPRDNLTELFVRWHESVIERSLLSDRFTWQIPGLWQRLGEELAKLTKDELAVRLMEFSRLVAQSGQFAWQRAAEQIVELIELLTETGREMPQLPTATELEEVLRMIGYAIHTDRPVARDMVARYFRDIGKPLPSERVRRRKDA
jgi:hypothetical protein